MNNTQISILNDLCNTFSNKSLLDLATDSNLISNNKSHATKVVKDYLNNNTLYNSSILEKYNLKLKFTPVNGNYKCYESLSLPFTSLYDIIFEKWETDDLLMEASIKKSLRFIYVIIPIIKNKKNGSFNAWTDWKIGEISVWYPNDIELCNIGNEWKKAQEIIKDGVIQIKESHGGGFRMKNNLLKESETEYIHLRPHGLNSQDLDKQYLEYTKGKIEITKQSFWLNKKFINQLLEKNKWKTNLKEE